MVKNYIFRYNGKTKVLSATSEAGAKARFMERFGFYPSDNVVEMTVEGETE